MWEFVNESEGQLCERLRDELRDIEWARPLLKKVTEAGGITKKNKDRLFELRFAGELYRLGLSAQYEYATGVGNTTVDFAVEEAGALWLIELVRIGISAAAKRATHGTEDAWEMTLSSNADDQTQSTEGEVLLVQQKIGEKVYSLEKAQPVKFPPVKEGVYHAIVVDMGGFQGGCSGDPNDCHVIAGGNEGLESWYRQYWQHDEICGLFDKRNRQRAAPYIQDRIHLLSFQNIMDEEGRPSSQHCFFCNPHLFSNVSAVQAALPSQLYRLFAGTTEPSR